MDYSKQVPAAERTLNLLEALAGAPEGLTAGELLDRLALSRSSLFALLNTLKIRDYIEQDEQRGRYRLGPGLWALMPGYPRGLGQLLEIFREEAEAADLPESAALAWLDRQETVIVAQRESDQIVRAIFQPGERRPADQTAAGQVLLAGLSPDRLKRHLPQPPAGFMNQLKQIRQEGLALTPSDEFVEAACPICADGSQPLAALLLRAPAFRWDDEAARSRLAQLRRMAARLSYRLGAPLYQPYGWATGEPLGPAEALSPQAIDQFLRGPWSVRLACLRENGAPHVVPLWYEWDGEALWLAASPGALWSKYIRSGQISLTIDEPWPPLRRAFIVGRAEIAAGEEIPGGLAGLRRRLAVRYLGQGAEKRPEFQQSEGWTAFRVIPSRITGRQGLGRAE